MNRIRTYALALTATALIGAGAFAQVDPSPAIEPGSPMMTPAQVPTPDRSPATPDRTPTPNPSAQMQTPAQTMTPAQTTTTVPRDDGFDWGWIGLVGLIGLAGLRRPEARPVDRDAAYPAKRVDVTSAPVGGVR